MKVTSPYVILWLISATLVQAQQFKSADVKDIGLFPPTEQL
ncbi:MAG: hypothetical protein OEV24_16190 [Cyclobacteriaceae bacterium]|nr:hypothetical protein [Cyclobacteriaceae bacterium]MDH5248781.1 hypothetical protein [Cyclobacteriaceae bacterium]